MPQRTVGELIDLRNGAAKSSRHDAMRILKRAPRPVQEWLRLAAEGSDFGLWYWNEQTQSLFCDLKTREMFGFHLKGEVRLDTFYKAVHPDDLTNVKRAWRYHLENGLPYDIEYRSLRPDESIRWINARGRGHYGKAGKLLYMIGVVFDVTGRKKAQEEREDLCGRLIDTQEQERSHLARELHDDLGQRLALMQYDLTDIRDLQQTTALRERVSVLTTMLDGIAVDMNSLSHRLHSSVLDFLGLVPGINSLCSEFGRQQGIPVKFGHRNIPEKVLCEPALNMFRIVQEGLHNVSKHSRASRVEVQLTADSASIRLTISDNGVGFNPAENHASHGIGIQSMRERARMLGGTFDIQSGLSVQGTTIAVTFPLQRAITVAEVRGTISVRADKGLA
jgi:PAS domain S-box-containing protein